MAHEGTQYICPMHPEVIRTRPGMCPECGMNLVPDKRVHSGSGHAGPKDDFTKPEGHSTLQFKRKFWVSLILTLPVLLYSELTMKVFGWQPPMFVGAPFLPFVLGSVVFFYGGWVFVAGAWRELRAKLPGMMTLIAIAIVSAYAYSVYATFAAPEHTLFWELTTLITIMLLGHWLEMRAVTGAQGALRELAKLLPDKAEIIVGNGTKTVLLAELKEGDVMLIKPGGKVPADGMVIEGMSELNESMITGESKPVAKKAKDSVIAGTINGDGSLKIKVTQIGEKTFLAGVMRLVAEAQASKSRLQILSDKAAYYLTIIAITAGLTTFIAWLASGAGIVTSTERLVAVLVVACPHALGLAVPLVASISTTMAARNGLLIKQRLALESARSIDIVLFDKTGTLTQGEFGVSEIVPGLEQEYAVLHLAASVDSHSEHPLARAIVREAGKRTIKLSAVKNFQRLPGRGAAGTVSGKSVQVGNAALLEENNITPAPAVTQRLDALSKQGKTIIYVISGKRFSGAIALADTIRPESREAITALKQLGLKTAMITGDSEDVAAWVAKELQLDEYFSRVLPDQKAEKVQGLQSKGIKVAMVGDGVNDAPALAAADLGIAIGAGTNVAVESAGIILVKNDPRDIPKIIKLSGLTYQKMIQNLWWATGYNVVAIPLAAGVLASWGIILQPALAAVFMSLSTIIVAINAVLMRKNSLTEFKNYVNPEKLLKGMKKTFFISLIVFLLIILIAENPLFGVGIHIERKPLYYKLLGQSVPSRSDQASNEAGGDDQELTSSVIPSGGIELAVTWGDIGKQLVSAGVIDLPKLEALYGQRGGLEEQLRGFLDGATSGHLRIDQDNAPFLLNLLWALGLGNSNVILETGEMSSPQYGAAANYASTGGWTLAKGDPMKHFARHTFMSLTEQEQALVDRIARNIYRPCCDNPTHFPDCNHGMAMLGLLELAAAQGASEQEMYQAALAANSYWFPDTYLTLAKYFKSQGKDWPVPASQVLTAEYSSASGYQQIQKRVSPAPAGNSGGCAV